VFRQYYKSRFKELLGEPLRSRDGLGDNAVRAKLAKARLTVPKALAEYYSLAGAHWINENHNPLRTIDKLEWIDDRLVFMEENQLVAYWGVHRDDTSGANPVVWQGCNGDPITWFQEPYPLAQFLMAMWKWTITGEEPEPAE
jgi:hypothetical protein